MKIAAIYDVHGNLPALEAALEDVTREGVELVVCGGDVVPGPMSRACLEALDTLSIEVRFLHGNGERDVLEMRRGEAPARVPGQFHEAMRWVADEMASGQLEAMESWPRAVRFEVEGIGDVLFCHATPRDENEIFTRRTPQELLRPIFEPTGASLVVCGHTHMQFDRRIGSVRVLNAGSVGMPFGRSGAHWALIGPEGVDLRVTSYDLVRATELIRATGYPGVDRIELIDPPSEEAMLELFEAAALL